MNPGPSVTCIACALPSVLWSSCRELGFVSHPARLLPTPFKRPCCVCQRSTALSPCHLLNPALFSICERELQTAALWCRVVPGKELPWASFLQVSCSALRFYFGPSSSVRLDTGDPLSPWVLPSPPRWGAELPWNPGSLEVQLILKLSWLSTVQRAKWNCVWLTCWCSGTSGWHPHTRARSVRAGKEKEGVAPHWPLSTCVLSVALGLPPSTPFPPPFSPFPPQCS